MVGRNQEQLIYRLLLAVLSPLLLLYLLVIAWREGGLRFWRQRRGHYGHHAIHSPLWLHAASVGEVNAILPLVRRLHEEQPELPLLLTTATPSGARIAKERLEGLIQHAYLPVDWPGAVKRFLDTYSPRCALITETEIWPHLYRAVGERNIPLLIINGRVSAKTLKAPCWLRRLYGRALANVTEVLARSELDKAGFIKLGAAPTKVNIVGNIKFATRLADNAKAIELDRPYVVVASSREEEEQLLVQAWEQAQSDGRLLVIVPRHPKRTPTILHQLGNRRIAVRSRGEHPEAKTAIYLADTFGELSGFLAGAELVIMGGSFVNKGGQNLLEPAALGKAILCGPDMSNFADETRLLREADAVVQVEGSDELVRQLNRLLGDTEACRQMGERARTLVAKHSDMAERYCEALRHYCIDTPENQ